MMDLVRTTKRRLMWFFAVLTMLFLLLFVVAAYLTVSQSVMKEKEDELMAMLSDKSLSRLIHEAEEPHEKPFNHNLFAIVGTSGNILEKQGDGIEAMIDGWTPNILETKEVDQDNREYLLAGKPVRGGGYVYSGVDVTEQKRVLNRLFMVLLILTILFTFAATLLSFIMAGKAIRPIIKSAERQRDFVNDASHELRTPLSILSAGFEILEEEKDRLSDFSRQTVDDLSGEVRRMSSLVNDLLVLARADSGKLVLEKKVLNLTNLVSRSVRSFSRIVEVDGISLTTDLKEEVYLKGDEDRLQQLLYLLLDNAHKYNVQDGHVHVSLKETGSEVILTVEDGGIGIAQEHQDKIFERFFRVDLSRSRTHGSNGIGLSIAAFIVEAHNGKVLLESKVGQGSCFTVVLPGLSNEY
ncbi:sensor histidine kinase [Pseudalkalibacillus hwajinpoensis]|uniref:sensor histidine kinase n=1 Tax=Guptibacillus hwajinpoensis TaxID=208199 RepID=UPI001CFD011F|nr:ATP-binding protein [Pseudalkalibacillus hwajinpoensis]